MKDIDITITGMSCGHCLNAVRNALTATDGIEVTSVQIGRATVRISDDPAAADRVKAAIEDAGYKVQELVAR
ncbi:MAG TPA: heavy-metal-associated domain-containing protein [Gemmatimonadales bacterium]|nr:heavy-metal-associated domain-containing protein [Gemmatimonadales bacterium]